MAFWSRWFSKNKSISQTKVSEFFLSEQRYSNYVYNRLDKIYNSNVGEILPEKIQFPLESFRKILSSLPVPIKAGSIPKNFKPGQFIGESSRQTLIALFSQEGLKPNPDLYRKLLNQEEIKGLAVEGLGSVFIEINEKINPLSGVMNRIGLEKQIHQVLYPIIPKILESLLSQLQNAKESPMAQKLFKNSMDIILNLGPEDILSPSSETIVFLDESMEKIWKEIVNDPIFQKESYDLIMNLYQDFRIRNKSKKWREVLVLPPSEFDSVAKGISKDLAHLVSQYEEETGNLSREYLILQAHILEQGELFENPSKG
jgi:hypothetical protein